LPCQFGSILFPPTPKLNGRTRVFFKFRPKMTRCFAFFTAHKNEPHASLGTYLARSGWTDWVNFRYLVDFSTLGI
jgi:hypothetical protein